MEPNRLGGHAPDRAPSQVGSRWTGTWGYGHRGYVEQARGVPSAQVLRELIVCMRVAAMGGKTVIKCYTEIQGTV